MKNNNNLQKYIQWLKEKNCSDNTIKTYIITIERHYGNIPITTQNIVNFVKSLIKKRREPNTCWTYVSALLSYAKFKKINDIDWEKIYCLIPKIQKKFYTTINEKELQLLKKVRFEKNNWLYERNNLILDFLFYTGLRVSELANIRHQDYQNNSLRVHGKGNKIRYVFLPDFLISIFRPNSLEYLFKIAKSEKISSKQVREVVRKKVKAAKIDKWISSHTFRRSLATNLYQKGGKLETIQKQLGHVNLNTTMNYIHNDQATLYQDYSKLFKETTSHQSLKEFSTAELFAEIERRVGGNHA